MIRSSNPVGLLFDGRAARRGNLRPIDAVRPEFFWLIPTLLILAALSLVGSASAASQATQQPAIQPPEESITQFGAINPYLGLTIDEIDLPGIPAEDANALVAMTPLKIGEALTRDNLRDAIKALFATGRFADIQAEVNRTETAGIRLRFITVANFFVGIVTVEGVNVNPSPNQLASATRLQLGELYTKEKLDAAKAGIERILNENGFHQSQVVSSEQRNEQQHQVDLTFVISLGPRAVVGAVTVQGDASYSNSEIRDVAKLHSGDPVISTRMTRALQRIRTRYQKQDRLLAQVSLASSDYRPERNAVDYVFQIDRGPVVEIESEGYKLSQRTLRRLVPIYQEGAVDEDLLNEGSRAIQNHMQALGFFEATVAVSQRNSSDGKSLRVVYTIKPGDRHKLAAIRISGNQYFPEEIIRARLQEATGGRFLSHGRYSEAMLEADAGNIKALYQASGYRQAEVDAKLVANYQNDPSLLAIDIKIKEGPQTRVAWVRVEGNYTVPEDQIPEISTAEGQGFDESTLAADRDLILGKYFNNGFSTATVDVAYTTAPAGPDGLPRVGVTFTIHEGEQFFTSQVFLDGLEHTRSGVARRELRVHQGEPLSQSDMLETQRRLYDLGLFTQVDTAIQNPEGTESRKNVIITVREGKRYTFDYGGGLEFQTGQPAVGTNQPLGQTGVSPRALFAVNRTNVGGRDQTFTFKGNVGRLQQRALINYDIPKLLNREDLHLSFTTFYDHTVDVATFTSKRLEASLKNLQVLFRRNDRDLTTISYGFTYRRVEASNIEVEVALINLLSKPTRVGSPNFLYVRNRRDNDLETTHGNYTSIEGGVAASYFGSEADFSRLLVKNATYYSFGRNSIKGRRFVFARSTMIGLENPFGGTIVQDPDEPATTTHSLIPLPERFYSGGGNSHRGFGLNQAGPRDPITGFPVGGSALFLNNVELRFPGVTLPYLHDSIGFTIFHDMGNVFARPQEMLPSIGRFHQPDREACFQPQPQGVFSKCQYNYVSHAVGVGVRYQTPIGPLTFDFGYNVNPPAFPSYTNITINRVNGTETGIWGVQTAPHFNFSFNVGQSF
ncbi:MAG TPA: POTRA domain-containing protein [Terriglobales bacterium]|nr:POTRA domain-containing protein [Terriglobales bacterium]